MKVIYTLLHTLNFEINVIYNIIQKFIKNTDLTFGK